MCLLQLFWGPAFFRARLDAFVKNKVIRYFKLFEEPQDSLRLRVLVKFSSHDACNRIELTLRWCRVGLGLAMVNDRVTEDIAT